MKIIIRKSNNIKKMDSIIFRNLFLLKTILNGHIKTNIKNWIMKIIQTVFSKFSKNKKKKTYKII